MFLYYYVPWFVVGQGGLGQSSGLGTGMGLSQSGWGIGQTGMGTAQTGMGVGQTGMGVGQTGMGGGSSVSPLGAPKFGTSPMFAGIIHRHNKHPIISTITIGQAQFGTRPMMGGIMGSTNPTRYVKQPPNLSLIL